MIMPVMSNVSDDSDEMEDLGEESSENEDLIGSDNESNVESENSFETGNETVTDEVNIQDTKIKNNPGWADAMAKILKTTKPKRKKTIVLAKAKKLKPISGNEEDSKTTFEIEGEEVEDSTIKAEPNKGKKEETKLEIERRIVKKLLKSKGRVKPSVLDKDREKVLQKVATKGVIQLFNAVRQQQKNLEKEIEKVGPSDRKQEKVLKSVDKKAFLDVLMGAKSQTVPQVKEEKNSEWSVLREDFMMGTKLKDWDKDDETAKTECE